jgi:hypothetical protein
MMDWKLASGKWKLVMGNRNWIVRFWKMVMEIGE